MSNINNINWMLSKLESFDWRSVKPFHISSYISHQKNWLQSVLEAKIKKVGVSEQETTQIHKSNTKEVCNMSKVLSWQALSLKVIWEQSRLFLWSKRKVTNLEVWSTCSTSSASNNCRWLNKIKTTIYKRTSSSNYLGDTWSKKDWITKMTPIKNLCSEATEDTPIMTFRNSIEKKPRGIYLRPSGWWKSEDKVSAEPMLWPILYK